MDSSLLLPSLALFATLATIYLLALFARHKATIAALEQRLAAQGDDLWTANAHLRVAALGRREDGRRIQLYRLIFGEVPVGLAVLRIDDPADPETWAIVEFNPSGLRLANAGSENPAGMRLFEFAPDARGTELPRACAEALRLNRGVAIEDYAGGGKTAGDRFSINVFPLGAPFVGIAFENITARKTAEEALAHSNKELSQFAFVASHDLQAPLRKIAIFSENLKKHLGDRLDATGRDYVERIGRSAVAMQALVDSLLELARVETSHEEPREVDLGAVAGEVISELGVKVDRDPLPVIMGDASQLRRLFENLIGNSLKFTAPGLAPRIRVRAGEREPGLCEIVIEDEGVGFDMQFASGLFQPFQRLHSRRDFPGSGMGLAICRKIVERHGGTIAAQSAAGRGTKVTIILPVRRAKETTSWNKESAYS